MGEVASHALSDVRILATSGSLIVAGTCSDGVWISTGNTGEEWQKASVGLPDGIISSLFIGESDLFNDMGESFLRKPLSEVVATVSPNARGVPTQVMLQQNYPNPFNLSTTIRYTIAGSREYGVEGRETKIVVYDILGREVATLVNEKKAPGDYEVRFDATGLASGVYFYRLKAGSFTQTRRLLLLR